jgi:hypothetical protein
VHVCGSYKFTSGTVKDFLGDGDVESTQSGGNILLQERLLHLRSSRHKGLPAFGCI